MYMGFIGIQMDNLYLKINVLYLLLWLNLYFYVYCSLGSNFIKYENCFGVVENI